MICVQSITSSEGRNTKFDAVYHKYNLKLLTFSLVVKISFLKLQSHFELTARPQRKTVTHIVI